MAEILIVDCNAILLFTSRKKLDFFSVFETRLLVYQDKWGNGVRNSRNLLCFWSTAQRVFCSSIYFVLKLLQFE